MNPEIIDSFVKFYIQTFNDKTQSAQFMTIWKDYSICVHNNVTFTKTTLAEYLNMLYAYKINIESPTDIVMSFTLNGERRANILLSYTIVDTNGLTMNLSQYMLLAYSNNKEFWIHTNIINIK